MKTVDLNLPIAELVRVYPELTAVLSKIGLADLVNDKALKVMGGIMTLERAAEVKKIEYSEVLAALEAAGFVLVNRGLSADDSVRGVFADGLLPEGHPIQLMRLENDKMLKLTKALKSACQTGDDANKTEILSLLQQLNTMRCHYAKKAALFMPLLYAYGVTGPSQVMWDEDDDLKRELGETLQLAQDSKLSALRDRLIALADHLTLMADKEEKILFPLSRRFFTLDDWLKMYADIPGVGMAFDEKLVKWDAGEIWIAKNQQATSDITTTTGEINLPTGKLQLKELIAMLPLLGLDITYIDANERLQFFTNEGHVFERPLAALGRDVFDYHPPKVVPVVKKLLAEFKAGQRDIFEVMHYVGPRAIQTRYLPVRDSDGNYMGTVELVQDCTHILKGFAK